MLKKFHPLFMSIHSNHPRELTTEVRDALGRLADAGIPLGNQSVLLKHVNDDAAVMKALVQKLLMCRVKPYYLYQCDLISGSAHLRASVRKGMEIMEQLRGHTTGYAVPQYVIDAPGGGGKVPINPEYVLCRNAGRVLHPQLRGQNFRISRSARRHAPRQSRRRKLKSRSWFDFGTTKDRSDKVFFARVSLLLVFRRRRLAAHLQPQPRDWKIITAF